ncbi:signal recognition particle protein [Geobacter sulfurreducens]|jgi:signal recognition particle subunit SRP54|uniref:Signal recognition particle protein n=1 Tax=Geobacter sulfurreducens (strain ATCC 51573 / DSM 12127 / PCA) TaxID=243231 RepID=Q74FG7_GEOSL|nr:signal recognition particle protein [Geobacter sulfurreducens]AAR33972.1 signal recognition particle protein [Geobacter sulfurreducens PCA]AJY70391.1 signal recognition particle [Geobacter sulfurreducens]QVW35881.1 signal recognition particle protein [Geobacter sulfurreducens]UAC04706.1 signal recognition particle protein [Geobacter sulfurreducens]UTG93335.1 signal recognition particle protein [Geobacter sulfurreducens]
MLENLSDKLDVLFKKLRGQGVMSEENIKEALREVRLVLLEADVNFKVVKDFVERVRVRAVGTQVLQSLTPGQQVIKIVQEELVALMGGGEDNSLDLAAKPPVPIMMVGLQGAGKTTSCGKLARLLKGQRRRPLLVPADVYRPAAIEQLKTLGRQLSVEVFDSRADQDPVDICREALRYATLNGFDVVILDTAGRHQIDEYLMNELVRIKEAAEPREILFVADAMTGQEAVNVASGFNDRLDITGVVLTKLDGDAKGGAALSIRAVTGKPVKLVGVGEKLDALEVFHADRLVSRILGMGDILTLVEKAQATFDSQEAERLQQKLKKSQFDLEDFRNQLQQIKKMGSIESILGMIPGVGKAMKQLQGAQPSERELKRIEAIIGSMTPAERANHAIINGSRRLRIAKGSGTTVQEVNQLLKRFTEAQKMMKQLQKLGPKGLMRGMKGMGKGMFPF